MHPVDLTPPNLSLCQGLFPKWFKITKITPQVKVGKNPMEAASYRPVSNLCAMGKLVEMAFFDQISLFTEQQRIISDKHHGGRKNHSTTTCMVEMTHSIQEGINKKKKVAVLAIDLTAAFDLCDHQIIIQKYRLDKMGDGEWLSSFLKDRTQYVQLGNNKSENLELGDKGVIQGSPSSGEIFTHYVNELPLQVNEGKPSQDDNDSEGVEFVDDLNVVVKADTIEELKDKIVKEYEAVSKYLINHKMVVNPSKTQIMFINPPKNKPSPSVMINGNTIHHQKVIKILGISLTEDMKMDEHIWAGANSMVKAINRKTALLRCLKPFMPMEALGRIGAGLINSTILYGAPVWAQTTQKNIDLLQKQQIKAARLITSKGWQRGKKKEHRQVILDQLGWPNIKQIANSAIINLTKKAIKHTSSKAINNMFTIRKPKAARKGKGTRIAHKWKINTKNNTFSTNAPTLFNILPIKLRDTAITCKKFKSNLKVHIRTLHHLQQH